MVYTTKSFDPYEESVRILRESTSSSEDRKIRMILEDVNSPVHMKYNQKLYDQIIKRGHINFDDIPNSKGDITKYSGYKNMKETLRIIKSMDEFRKTNVVDYVDTIEKAIENITSLRDVFTKGFASNTTYIMLEYNTYVYACVEGTTSILYEFVDYIKRPGVDTYQIVLKNNSYRANLFYIEQLAKFNNMNNNMLSDYRKFLLSLINKDKDNFVGVDFMIGAVAIAAVLHLAVPTTRSIIYAIGKAKISIADACDQQAYFLEINKSQVESNDAFTVDKKKKILEKQEALRKKLLVISDKLRVSDVKAVAEAKKDLEKENKEITVSNIRKEIDDSAFSLF